MTSLSSDQLWAEAVNADKAGRTDYARNLYQQVLDEYPHSAAAGAAVQYLEKTRRAPVGDMATIPVAPAIQSVRVVDLDISFASLVGLFVKAALAAIPAAIIVAIFWTFALAVIGAINL